MAFGLLGVGLPKGKVPPRGHGELMPKKKYIYMLIDINERGRGHGRTRWVKGKVGYTYDWYDGRGKVGLVHED